MHSTSVTDKRFFKKNIKKGFGFIFGLFIIALGVALSVKADLGVSPISCIPYIYSLKYPFTFGQATIVFSIIIILLQMLILRKAYHFFQLIQLPIILIFGYFIDLTMRILQNILPSSYMWKISLCILSCFVLAIGVTILIKVKISYLPGEGLITAIANTYKKDFGLVKIAIDSSMAIIGIISSYFLLNELSGIGIGTIIAALLVGYLVKFFNRTSFNHFFNW